MTPRRRSRIIITVAATTIAAVAVSASLAGADRPDTVDAEPVPATEINYARAADTGFVVESTETTAPDRESTDTTPAPTTPEAPTTTAAPTTQSSAPVPASEPTSPLTPAPAPSPAPAPTPASTPTPAVTSAPASTTTAAPPTTAAPAPSPATTAAPAPAPAPAPATSSQRSSSCEANLAQWTNQARAAAGLAPLVGDGGLRSIPLTWSDSMASRQSLSHNPNYGNQVFAARPQAMTAGENVGRGTGSDRMIFDEFMRSASHRAHILGSQFTHAATGCVIDAGGQYWVTVNFWG